MKNLKLNRESKVQYRTKVAKNASFEPQTFFWIFTEGISTKKI